MTAYDHPQRPMNAEHAIEWLDLTGVVAPERLIKLAHEGRISYIKLPFNHAYLFKVEHLLDFINSPDFERLRGVNHSPSAARDLEAESPKAAKVPRSKAAQRVDVFRPTSRPR